MASILIVDDDPAIRALLSEALIAAGHRTSEAGAAREGIGKLKRRPYDVVLLDIKMPGYTGYDFLTWLRAMPSRSDTPVVVLTAHHDPHGVMREAELGATDHLAKPFLVRELEEAIERALGDAAEIEDRKQVLLNEAETYGSLIDLVQSAREDESVSTRR